MDYQNTHQNRFAKCHPFLSVRWVFADGPKVSAEILAETVTKELSETTETVDTKKTDLTNALDTAIKAATENSNFKKTSRCFKKN